VSPRPARRSRDDREIGAPAADQRRRYFVPLVLGLEGELGVVLGLVDELPDVVSVELEPDVDGAVVVDGTVLDGGDADGARSDGRSPTRSVRDSLQAVSRPRLSATAKTAVSILFISMSPPCGVARPKPTGCNGHAGTRRLDRSRANHYQCGVIRAVAKEMRA